MRAWADRLGWAVAGALAVILLSTLARAAEGGPLDPPGPVSSTMRTLDGLTPSWSLLLPSDDAPGADNCNSTRFQCVLQNDEGVLDKETGLVWLRTPLATTITSWGGAVSACTNQIIGGRGGWHLPTIEELSTLFPFPADTPFSGTDPLHEYWSSTLAPFNETFALTRVLGEQNQGQKDIGTTGARSWCVRGGATPGG